jgi:hypothetical protein
MFALVYRKNKDSADREWHFHTQCPRWPEVTFEQVRTVDHIGAGERICNACIRLEVRMFGNEGNLAAPKTNLV